MKSLKNMSRVLSFLYCLTLIFLAVNVSYGSESALTVLMPIDKTVVSQNPIYIIGKVGRSGVKKIEVILNGNKSTVLVKDKAFYKKVDLKKGENKIELKVPAVKPLVLKVNYQPDSKNKGVFKLHPALEEGCQTCHQPGSYKYKKRAHSNFCYECHDRLDTMRYVHGPVGGGECIFCHDPHGSVKSKYLVEEGKRLCILCHDQPVSQGHMVAGKNKNCTSCHNPHGTDKKFHLSQ